VGQLAQAFATASNAARPSESLAGRTLDLHFEDGQIIRHRFDTGSRLFWAVTNGPEHQAEVSETYLAFEMRPGIYLVDFAKHMERTTAVSLALDLGSGIVTALVARLPEEREARESLVDRAALGKELTAVSATFLSGAVDQPFTADTPRHPTTAELVGRRVEYAYSPTQRYEHIYLNERFYTWQCLSGEEKGLTDTDRCHYYKLADNLYFFVWREKIIPTVGAAVIDFDLMRSAGKIFGYQAGDFGQTTNFAIGAHARLLNVTKRDEG
jgi:hypothetical protein